MTNGIHDRWILLPALLLGVAAPRADIAVDYVQAERLQEWLDQAAIGEAAAQYQVASSYLWGRGTVVDLAAARRWFEQSAAQGYHKAQYRLGYMHLNGLGGPVNGELARLWLQRAADQGYAPAQFYLGEMYALGLAGTRIDRLLAVKWITASVQDGYRPRTDELERIREVLDRELQHPALGRKSDR